MPQKTSSLLSAPGSNFGLGRVQPTSQPTRQQVLAILSLLADLTPAGDVMAMGSGLANRDALEFGLGAASLLLPGTIKPEYFRGIDEGINKASKQETLERMLRAENKGDARVSGIIKKLQEQEANGLITAGERQRALNQMTLYSKQAKARPGIKIGGIQQKTIK